MLEKKKEYQETAMKAEIGMWIAAVLLPAIILTTALLILRQRRTAPHTLSHDTPRLADISPSVSSPSMECGSTPVLCNPPDASRCADTCGDGWTCTSVEPNDTDFGVQGNFCLPSKPTTACTQLPTDSNERMQGVWRWTGWSGVNVQGWDCACPYPAFYPMDTTAGSISHGACKKSSQLCRGGVWNYPCVSSSPSSPCAPLSDDERAALVGSDVLTYGRCECEEGDRLSMDTSSGLPVCVPDTCTASPRCDAAQACPGNASCVNGMCSRSTSQCEQDEDCGTGGSCEADGRCIWGKWKVHNISPYVFGECECPESCHSVGTRCAC